MARGTGGVFLRGKTWYIHYSVQGILHKESAKTRVKSEAVALLKRRTGEASRGEIAMGNPDMSLLLDGVLEDYESRQLKSAGDVANRIARLKERWGSVKAKHFTASQVQMHIQERRSAEIAPATVNRELAILRRAFTLARESGQVATAPKIKALPENNARQGFFSDAEFSRLRGHLPQWMRTLATFAYFTGCRLGELRGMQWGQVDLSERVVKLGKTKNGHPRTVPLSRELHAMLTVDRAAAQTSHVFEHDGEPVGKFDIYEPWAEACAAASLEGRLFHDFRRTGVRNMTRAGVPRHIAMAISGHKTDSMFRRYDIVDEKDLRAAAAKLDTYLDQMREAEASQDLAQPSRKPS
jgi:integrase